MPPRPRREVWVVLASLLVAGATTALLWQYDSRPDTVWISRDPVTGRLDIRLDPNGPIDGPWFDASRVDEVPGEFVFLERRLGMTVGQRVLRWCGRADKSVVVETVGYRKTSRAALSSGAQEYRRIPDAASEEEHPASDDRR